MSYTVNYIEHIKGFWILQENNQLGTSEIALYLRLTEVWNTTGWVDVFKRNNYQVMSSIGIKTFKTFQSYRDKLRAAGALNYRQRNGDANAEYRMVDLSKIYRGLGKGLGKRLGEGSVEGSGVVNINQTKPNLKGGSTRAGEKNDFFTEEPPGPEPEVPCAENFLFQDCLNIYDGFVRKRSPVGPMIDEDQETALKCIIEHLQEEQQLQLKIYDPELHRGQINDFVKERWRIVMDHWHLLPDFHQRRIKLTDIRNDLTNVLTQIHHAISASPKGAGSPAGNTGTTSSNASTVRGRGASVDALQNRKRTRSSGDTQQPEFTEAETLE